MAGGILDRAAIKLMPGKRIEPGKAEQRRDLPGLGQQLAGAEHPFFGKQTQCTGEHRVGQVGELPGKSGKMRQVGRVGAAQFQPGFFRHGAERALAQLPQKMGEPCVECLRFRISGHHGGKVQP